MFISFKNITMAALRNGRRRIQQGVIQIKKSSCKRDIQSGLTRGN